MYSTVHQPSLSGPDVVTLVAFDAEPGVVTVTESGSSNCSDEHSSTLNPEGLLRPGIWYFVLNNGHQFQLNFRLI